MIRHFSHLLFCLLFFLWFLTNHFFLNLKTPKFRIINGICADWLNVYHCDNYLYHFFQTMYICSIYYQFKIKNKMEHLKLLLMSVSLSWNKSIFFSLIINRKPRKVVETISVSEVKKYYGIKFKYYYLDV